MNTSSTVLSILIILLLGLAGYYYLDQVRPMQASLDDLQRKKEELQFRVEQLQSQNVELTKRLETQVSALSSEKEEEIAKLQDTYDELLSELEEQMKKGEVTITKLADQLKVNILDRVLFPSGEAGITPDGIRILTKVGGILRQVQDKRIRIEGHTDNVPIHSNLQDDFPTNWELSVARATNVVRFLTEEMHVDPQLLEATGFGEYQPIATNKTPKGRAQNRRIEIVLLPLRNNVTPLTKN